MKISATTRVVFCLFYLSCLSSARAGLHAGIRSLHSGPTAHETCALLADRRAYCWGETPDPSASIGQDIADFAIGQAFRCALTTGGMVYCWGHNGSGQLGDGSTLGRDVPQPVRNGSGNLDRVTAITAGNLHACALRDGMVWCWGDNTSFQIGNYMLPASTNALSPVQVLVHRMGSSPPLGNLTQISAGGFHTCALLSDNTGACWGNGHDGELGNGVFGSPSNSPVPVKVDSGGLVNLTMGGAELRSGGYSSCGLVADVAVNSVACWGLNNRGQLGIGTTADHASAVPVSDERGKIVDAVSIANAGYSACAIVADSTVRCWGSDEYLQLGLAAAGSDQGRGVQVMLQPGVPLKRVMQIVAGAQHFCAMTLTEEVYCWGDNVLRPDWQRRWPEDRCSDAGGHRRAAVHRRFRWAVTAHGSSPSRRARLIKPPRSTP